MTQCICNLQWMTLFFFSQVEKYVQLKYPNVDQKKITLGSTSLKWKIRLGDEGIRLSFTIYSSENVITTPANIYTMDD